MEDRFKFRVWCKNKKEWEKDEIMISNNGKYFITYADISKPFLITDQDPEYHVINFCTGLKDDNGKLIYEGDILKYAEFDWNDFAFKDWETNQAVVIWGGKYDYPAFDLKDTDFDGTNGLAYLFGAGWHFEVVGNIYENPELMGEKLC